MKYFVAIVILLLIVSKFDEHNAKIVKLQTQVEYLTNKLKTLSQPTK